MTRVILLLVGCIMFTASSWAVPAIQAHTLSNGVRVLLMESHGIPMVSASLMMPAGSRYDRDGKGGSASLLADMLVDHTKMMDQVAWSERLDEDAIQLAAGVDKDTMSISLTVLKEMLPQGVDVLQEGLLSPGWRTDRFKQLQEDAISGAKKSEEEPGVRAGEVMATMLFPNHPYGHRSSGSATSLAAISLVDLQTLYAAQCKPEGAVLAVSGDVTMEELVGLFEPALHAWHGKPVIAANEIARPAKVAGKQQQITMPTTQMMVQLFRTGPKRLDHDFFSAFVLNHIMGGGGFASRLMEEVREKRGMVYGVYSYFMPLETNGPFMIGLQTRANQAGEAVEIVEQVMQDLYLHGVTQQELDAAKSNLVGGFAQRMDSNRERVGLIGMIGFYRLPLDYLQTWQQRVNSVTLQEVHSAAERYLEPKSWNRVYVGPMLSAPGVLPH
ncbi:MAG: insulinase family protein [Zetaproteobacteria bacterium]|nr:insulinase family protein [Zetaproteobacteria bacterium]